MEKRGDLNVEISNLAKKFLEDIREKNIQIISHFDTDGITSATIMIKTLKRMDKKFSIKILKSLEDDFINSLPKNRLTVFLDLASGSLNQISNSGLENVYIIDHHEVVQEVPANVNIINPELHEKQKISSSGLTYLFCREIDEKNKEFAKLGVLGMIGDMLEKNISKINNGILNDGDIKRRRGLLIYPSTRPLNRALEYSSDPFIPGVTGNTDGVINLLKESGLFSVNGKYKCIIELDDAEMSKLVTGIMLRNPQKKNKEIIGDIYLIKFFNKLEDARELSAVINACSRIGDSSLAIQFCMEIPKAKKMAEKKHVKYKQLIVSGLRFITESEKIIGKGFVIINAKDKIKDTIIGTLTSIISNSSMYEEGTIITSMAYYDEKIKVSMRNVGENTRNLREILNDIVEKTGGNVGGHQDAAGCIILKEKEQDFIELLKKSFEIELIKI